MYGVKLNKVAAKIVVAFLFCLKFHLLWREVLVPTSSYTN